VLRVSLAAAAAAVVIRTTETHSKDVRLGRAGLIEEEMERNKKKNKSYFVANKLSMFVGTRKRAETLISVVG
jgi:hypothetical protein